MTSRSALLAATALAALALPASVPARAQAISGLYIGAGAGVNFMQDQRTRSAVSAPFTSSPAFSQGFEDPGYVTVGSIGYGLGNGLRFELEGSYRYNRFDGRRLPGQPSSGGREEKYGPMVNALYDIDPAVFGFLPIPLNPYVGVGVGYQWAAQHGQSVSLSNGYNIVAQRGGTDGSFAVQAIIGTAFPIAAVPGLSLTAEYRFMALTDSRNYGGPLYTSNGPFYGRNATRTDEDYNHAILLGARYAFNAAPPPVVAPGVLPPVAQSSARTYLVFFDWDRADLTDRARQIIAEAARASTQLQVTRIQVNGNTDTTGTARYNQGLSVRRAEVVAAELVRDGVPRAAIATQGFGFSRLLVPTGPGVREPQNRRVEIVLQ